MVALVITAMCVGRNDSVGYIDVRQDGGIRISIRWWILLVVPVGYILHVRWLNTMLKNKILPIYTHLGNYPPPITLFYLWNNIGGIS